MDRGKFRELGAGVARELGALRSETWTVTEQEHAREFGLTLNGPGQARLSMLIGWRGEGKVAIGSIYPEGTGGLYFQANIDPARGALVIAKEANRRVIAAGYADALLVALERKREQDEREAARSARMAEVAALFGTQQTEDHKVYLGEFIRGNGHVEEYYSGEGDALNIELSGIPREVGMKMLQVLAQAASSQATCCYRYGPGHDTRLSRAGCLHPGSCGAGCTAITEHRAGTPNYDEAEALFSLYRNSGSGQDWAGWLGEAHEHIHPAWR